jgi:hypothetical protein
LPFVGILPTLNLTWGKLKKKGKPSGVIAWRFFLCFFYNRNPLRFGDLGNKAKILEKRLAKSLTNRNPLP